eukprot:SAG31_NODE_5252_length_2648_cov_4.339741_2_plen_160_part_00
MLRENVAYQREQLKEAQNYAETHPESTYSARFHLRSQSGIGEDWRHGMEIRPFHAAEKRLAFAKLFYTATRSTTGMLDHRGVPRPVVDVDADVATRVGCVPCFVSSSHIHICFARLLTNNALTMRWKLLLATIVPTVHWLFQRIERRFSYLPNVRGSWI